MSYLKPVVIASTMLVASLSLPAFADHMNYAATSPISTNIASLAGRNSPKSDVSCFNWEKRIFVGGLVNVDTVYSERGWADPFASIFGGASDLETPPFYSNSVHGSDIVINNANLFVDAKINNATTAHIGVAYTQRPGELGSGRDVLENVIATVVNGVAIDENNENEDRLDFAFNLASPADFGIDEAYITFHDCASPFYFQAGRKFTSFGNYNPYPITYSLTQLLEQTNEEVLQFGYTGNDGLSGSIYAFNGPFSGRVPHAINLTSRINNYGVDVGYGAQYGCVNYNLGAGYIKDMRDSNFLSHRLANDAFNLFDILGTPVHSSAAYELHADMNNGPFVLTADYVAAVRNIFDTTNLTAKFGDVATRFWAYGLEAGYGFDSMGYASNASLGYQRSGNASLIAMPRYRVLADYTVEVSRNAKVTLEYTHSTDYKASDVGSGFTTFNACGHASNNSTNTATVRIGVAI